MHYPLWHPTYWLATWFHSGLFPKAPGTVGTLAAIPFAGWLYHATGALGLLAASGAIFIVGWGISALYVRYTGKQDPKEVVIDEVAGMWFTLAIVLIYWPQMIADHIHSMLDTALWLTAPCFVAFRFFDILKLWPISWLDRHVKGGLGIMLDDMLAGVFAAFTVLAIYYGISTYGFS